MGVHFVMIFVTSVHNLTKSTLNTFVLFLILVNEVFVWNSDFSLITTCQKRSCLAVQKSCTSGNVFIKTTN